MTFSTMPVGGDFKHNGELINDVASLFEVSGEAAAGVRR